MGLKKDTTDYMLVRHATLIGIKPDWFSVSDYATAVKLTPMDGFEDSPTMNNNEITGQTGSTTIIRANVKTTASNEPTWKQTAIFGEFLEDFFKLELGGDDLPFQESEFPLLPGATKARRVQVFRVNDENSVDLPFSTIYNAYYATTHDAVVYNNQILNTLELSVTKGEVTITPTFKGWYGVMNQPNPIRLESDELSRLVKEQLVKFYVADVGTNLLELYRSPNAQDKEELEQYYYPCATEFTLDFNNNVTDSDCLGEDLGEGNVLIGDFKAGIKLTTKWNENSKKLLSQYVTGSSHGSKVSPDSLFKETLIVLKGAKIETINDEDIYEDIAIFYPKNELIDPTDTPKSGTERKTITFTFAVSDTKGLDKSVIVDMITRTTNFAYAQTKAIIYDGNVEPADVEGILRSPIGQPVAGTVLTFTNNETSTSTNITTESDGTFLLEDLAPGIYTVSVPASADPAYDAFTAQLDVWYGMSKVILSYDS
ncbi:MAG: carboxypeptidase-like regulatory domain-containing protein [Methanobrevibacter sp.]|jgi:hypothetical protein|nr:carboxypeptidase-like regulatory domain-containing protein [Methanobrevibacter sp.]